jgi:hypothetical protein
MMPTPNDAAAEHLSTATADQLRALLDVYRLVNDEAVLTDALEHLADAACRLIGAKFAAVAVIGADGDFDDVVAAGAGRQTWAAVGMPKPACRCSRH